VASDGKKVDILASAELERDETDNDFEANDKVESQDKI